MSRVFLDMDGVIADFEAGARASELDFDVFKCMVGSYRDLPVMDGAREAISELEARGYDVFIATKIPAENPYAASEKIWWIKEHFPELIRKIIITHDKGLLGCESDILVDDRPHKANCGEFAGEFVAFDPNNVAESWSRVLEVALPL